MTMVKSGLKGLTYPCWDIIKNYNMLYFLYYQANTRISPNAESMLAHCLRRWPNMEIASRLPGSDLINLPLDPHMCDSNHIS